MLAKRRQLLTAATNKAYWMFKYIKFLSHAGEERGFLLVNTRIHHGPATSQRAPAAPPTAVPRPSLAALQHVLAAPLRPASARRPRRPSLARRSGGAERTSPSALERLQDAGAASRGRSGRGRSKVGASASGRENRCFSSAMFVPRCENSCRANQRHLAPRGRNPPGGAPRIPTLPPPRHKGESGRRVTAGHGVKCRTRG